MLDLLEEADLLQMRIVQGTRQIMHGYGRDVSTINHLRPFRRRVIKEDERQFRIDMVDIGRACGQIGEAGIARGDIGHGGSKQEPWLMLIFVNERSDETIDLILWRACADAIMDYRSYNSPRS